jgi:ferritin-like metal-binding protein YciE
LSSERQIVEEGLPAMIKAATSADLRDAFKEHLEESRVHVSRLEQILRDEAGEADESKCKVTAALISEAGSSAGDIDDDMTRDVFLIAAGNMVEHHEIAVYGTLCAWADDLGKDQQAKILERTLQEEKAADEKLTMLSTQINIEAPVA